MRNAPTSAEAQELSAWLKNFFTTYVMPGLTGMYSGETHVGMLADWGLARYYSPEKIAADTEGFIKLLMKADPSRNYKGMSRPAATVMAHRIVNGNASITLDGTDAAGVKLELPPGAPSMKGRVLDIDIE